MGWSGINPWGKRAVAASAAAALLAGGYGGYAWVAEQTPGARLAEACGGMLPVDEVLGLTGTTASGFGGDDLELSSNTYDDSPSVDEPDGLPTFCEANSVRVRIETASSGGEPVVTGNYNGPGEPLPVPLPADWSGFLVSDADGDSLGASVLLDCPNWDRRHGSGILVNVETWDYSAVLRDTARVATRTAERAARATGCEAEPGGRIGEVDSPDATVAHLRAHRAEGTCKGVASHLWVLETAARTAPVESCVLEGALELRSVYGPYVRNAGEQRYGGWESATGATSTAVWGSAACGGAQGDAVYSVHPVEDSGRSFADTPLTRSEHADLRTFAEASAKRHGCAPPELPAPPRG
ncbi:hypothetical protein [Streptomonospora wellingtoniae]|uniref:Uncharacterized protein n=1 Tax=Streptomonospora wellingtoniae TaxID=3075544 RepID=A0ABU2L0U9_9ACTN|nr:hypothetical protein [Streptomonospora sp. DSM 45055]MDT0305036.1 hypothetical protein [Streptomonospora sp. DSM 45055]